MSLYKVTITNTRVVMLDRPTADEALEAALLNDLNKQGDEEVAFEDTSKVELISLTGGKDNEEDD